MQSLDFEIRIFCRGDAQRMEIDRGLLVDPQAQSSGIIMRSAFLRVAAAHPARSHRRA